MLKIEKLLASYEKRGDNTRKKGREKIRAIMEWADYRFLTDSRYFTVTQQLVGLEIGLDKEIPDSSHPSRKFEYPWAYRNLLPLTEESIVLEVGPGNTAFQFLLSGMVKEGHSLDMNPEHVDWINKVIVEKSFTNLFPVLGDVTDMGFASDFFDRTVCISTLEHLPKEKTVEGIDELIRVTKPGGKIVLTMDVMREEIKNNWFQDIAKRFDLVMPELHKNVIVLSCPPFNTPFAIACIVLTKKEESGGDEEVYRRGKAAVQNPAKEQMPVHVKEDNSKPLYKQYLNEEISEGKQSFTGEFIYS